MKQLFVILIFSCSILLFCCEQNQKKEEDSKLEHETEKIIHSIKEGDVEILMIDNCEYIVYKETIGANHSFGYMAHKGNCKNPIHCYVKQNVNLVNGIDETQ